ncbi:MAG: cupin domain-containing protein, partial [Thermodesulfobacteriota bacterium]
LEGEFSIVLGGEEFRAKPGDFISLPRGIRHSFRSDSDKIGRMLVIVSPSGFEKFFDAVGEPVDDDTIPPPPPSKEHIQKVIEEAPRFGIELIL